MYAEYPSFVISEDSLRTFLRASVKKTPAGGRFLGSLAVALAVGAGGFYALNMEAFQRISQAEAVTVASPVAVPTPVAMANVPAATPAPTPVPVVVVPDIPNNTLSFGDLNISAPVSWDIPSSDTKLLNATLPNSVVQLAGTAHPGQHGIVAISGHSSNYPWIKGSYNSVFASLQSAKAGQTIKLSYNNVVYSYRVTRTYVVKPTQLEVLNAADFDGLRLITCTPIGTSTNRLIVEARQVSPDPAGNAAYSQAVFKSGSIPSGQ